MTEELTYIKIYTDGGADPNPGPGGWGAILIHPKKTRELSGGDPDTTNNRMELTAAIEALKALTRPCHIDFYTDSEYLKNGITKWVEGWIAKGWKNVSNVDLWKQLIHLVQPHEIEWHWVKGHAGNEYNERADHLATEARPAPMWEIDPAMTRVCLRVVGGERTQGPYGWAAVVVRDEVTEILQGGHPNISPNHFQVRAAIAILEQLPPDEPIQFFVNNSYLYDGITKWIDGWRRSGWQRPQKFKEDWQRLDALTQARPIVWVRFGRNNAPDEYALLKDPAKTALDNTGQR